MAVSGMMCIYLWLLLHQRIEFSTAFSNQGRVFIWHTYIHHCTQNFKITLLTVTQNLYLSFLALKGKKKMQCCKIQPIQRQNICQMQIMPLSGSTACLLEFKSESWARSEEGVQRDMHVRSFNSWYYLKEIQSSLMKTLLREINFN